MDSPDVKNESGTDSPPETLRQGEEWNFVAEDGESSSDDPAMHSSCEFVNVVRDPDCILYHRKPPGYGVKEQAAAAGLQHINSSDSFGLLVLVHLYILYAVMRYCYAILICR